ncbi:MAG: hypothetical protein ACXWLV_07840 [Rhizomicrobium sp.]
MTGRENRARRSFLARRAHVGGVSRLLLRCTILHACSTDWLWCRPAIFAAGFPISANGFQKMRRPAQREISTAATFDVRFVSVLRQTEANGPCLKYLDLALGS